MNNTGRFGCLTGMGAIAALITLFVLVGVAFASGGSMFSAGALNADKGETMGGVASHAEIKECKSCHAAPWSAETMSDRCLACHTNIAQQMLSVAQLHGAIVQKDPRLACRDCHMDHRGPTASLTDMGAQAFPHEALGYSLEGHQRKANNEAFVCSDCHSKDVTTFASDSCQNCHSQMDIAFAQAHALSFGMDCLACHDGVDRLGSDFNHNTFAFQLIGEHNEASCTDCHLDARSLADLQSASQDCASCHLKDDPHAGAYGAECGVCHTPDGWTPAKFDHNLSTFKLEGEHSEVACEECHVNNVFKGTPSDCYSCHQQDDEHDGRFGTQCESCHNPSDWENATFDHDRTNFPLNGAHSNTRCEECHTNGTFEGLSTACVNCHADPAYHAGAFGTDCAACHTTSAWSPATFNFPHPEPRVDEGGSGIYHGGASCRECHPNNFREATCVACHEGNNFEDGEHEGGDD
ncbi:MAG TPA: cytochrome c3 family protein [Anaerolineales bacterium]|nr:cytochrome c3 family protein [Anaerolineales bacterium]HNN14346.1 cytochrome c3 family protein [Anaerolineales bacterium]HNO31908.1 cytochrome c3 family protein [Anaerolineales bacterium]